MNYNVGLSENEWYIMQVLWEKSSASLREICESLKSVKGWSKHAVSSFLKRMLEKGAITVDESGSVRMYSPVWNRDETLLEETHSVLERIYRGDILLMMSNAVKDQNLSKEEIDKLKQMLDQIEV